MEDLSAPAFLQEDTEVRIHIASTGTPFPLKKYQLIISVR